MAETIIERAERALAARETERAAVLLRAQLLLSPETPRPGDGYTPTGR